VALIIAPIVVVYKTLGFSGWIVVLVLIGLPGLGDRASKRATHKITEQGVAAVLAINFDYLIEHKWLVLAIRCSDGKE
jgi:hypothetical protein